MRACREAHQIKKLSKWLLPSNELSGKSYRALRKIVARTQEQQHGAKENAAMICHQNCETDHRSITGYWPQFPWKPDHSGRGSQAGVALPEALWKQITGRTGSGSQTGMTASRTKVAVKPRPHDAE
ncbi:hypothetical protein Pst134EA_011916 [Puccinia striiformis f. sp. tritici]|uniref:hypothetical protein n=1 Tax=Puccinia striiformis f. sp. tritici TaxID=168172 RepID=UPI002007DE58|nr:hypothetical protein Pst134EA_011916 [Puccinia striiformis f. sp. tritici]KAH9468293.1 hypothetical protein Pst134EA_011916 [Puccinia striiformis f. sp. tritici]KAI9619514.1 hypothetical protein H4Q26_014279 [Puccinia striiformis f. sp. tritici PST-130]